MSWPEGPWTIKEAGCELGVDDQLMLVSHDGHVDIEVTYVARTGSTTRSTWGAGLVYLGEDRAEDTEGIHVITYTPAVPPAKAVLKCTYDSTGRSVTGGRRPEAREVAESRRHRHAPHDDGGHGGGTGNSWTAEEGG